jgi:hypothetical protein
MKRIAILAALTFALVLVVVVGGAAQADCFATNCLGQRPRTLSGHSSSAPRLRRSASAREHWRFMEKGVVVNLVLCLAYGRRKTII